MTTPPTPAGWYPDPDGSGGQRYWDGFAWTDHRSPATPEPAHPSEPPAAALPGSEQPTAVVKRPSAGEHVGSHRKPETEPTAEPEPGPTAVINLDSVPREQPTSPVIPQTPPSADDDRRKLIIWFGAACAALLAVLVVVVIYGVFFNMSNTITASPAAAPTTSEAATPTTTAGNGWGTETATATESPTAPSGSGAQGTDGGLTFTVTGVESGPTVTSAESPVEKTAQGEYIVVHLTVTNTGAEPAVFIGVNQKLNAGGLTYYVDDEATFYVGGNLAELAPGDQADVAVAFDVPPGTTPESIELHDDPLGPGVQVPL